MFDPERYFYRSTTQFFIGVDLGQVQDYTAIAVVEGGQIYQVRHLVRERGIPYHDIVDQIYSLMHNQELENRCTLVADQTGVGAPVVDLIRRSRLDSIAITITGGDKAHAEEGKKRNWRVPKRDLISNLLVLSQNGRLKIAAGLKEAST